MTPHPAQAATSAPHMPAANITSTPEVSIGASILWAFLLTATHNLTLAEHSTLPPGLQHAVPETTSAPLEIYSTPRLQVSTTNPAGVSQPLLLLMSGNKSSVTEFVVEPFRTMPTMFPPLPQESQPTPLVYLIPRKGGRTAGQNRSSLMARLIDDREGGTTLSGGNTVRFSGNGKLLAKPRTMSPVNTQTSGGSKEPPVLLRSSSTHEPPDEGQDSLPPPPQPPSGESEGSPEVLIHSLVTPDPSGSPKTLTIEAVASPEPLTTRLVPEVESSLEPEPEPLPFLIVSEVEGSPEPEPLITHSVPEVEGSPEPPPKLITALFVASQLPGESETFAGSSAASSQKTPASTAPIVPEGCNSSSQQPPNEGCSHSATLQASESSSFLPEAHETNETVNDTAGAEAREASRGSGIQWSTFKVVMFVVQFVIMVETVFGNLMVILSVKMEKKLQTPFNYYIVNLAFTDMNVGISVMSLFMIYNLYDYFPFNAFLCHYWVWSDYTMTFESVMTLAAISIDRLWSVTWSLHYRNHNSTRKSLYIILGTWCLVGFIWLPPFLYDRVVNVYAAGDCYWDTVLNKNLVAYVGFLGYYTPLLVMLGAYAKILLVVRKRAASIRDAARKDAVKLLVTPMERTLKIELPSIQADPSSGGGGGGGSGGGGGDQKRLVAGAAATQPKDDKQEQKLKREMKAVYTLLNIVVIFLLCWVPFYILFVLSAWFPTLFPTWYVTFSYWMAYINSAVNPILYPLSSPEFRQAYKKVLRAMIGRA
ncbi:5-hydroxytryptamine receptor 1-like [Portunus trituberculatus]|uniref:5-hydroxytryptamine receptor 1-like n=1 Tax=Portunus trituberculatus TaxID=210409 RepID=UPI001E1CFEC1|nr:5-hydroxytryptamine receptor 1-like [Portunus trituberculatus]